MDANIDGLERELTLRLKMTFTSDVSGKYTLAVITSRNCNVIINDDLMFSYNQQCPRDLLDSPAFEQLFHES